MELKNQLVLRGKYRVSKASTTHYSEKTHRKSKKSGVQQPLCTKILCILLFTYLLYNYNHASSFSASKLNEASSILSSSSLSNSKIQNKKISIRQQSRDYSSSVDQVVDFLISLAQKSTHDIRSLIPEESLTDNSNNKDSGGNSNADNDIFDLQSLATKNVCPFTSSSTLPAWLPPTLNSESSELFKHRQQQGQTIIPMVWYEHLSKAGGTTFCEIAQSNMPRGEVPRYYCMPSEQKLKDARVGLWSNEKLKDWIHTHSHRIVANEWNPFPPERLWYNKLQEPQPSHEDGGKSSSTSRLLFVTTIRHPLNRLLSAYNFWGVLHGPQRPLSFPKWLQRKHGISKKEPSRSLKIAPHVSRYNYITWKFSNGTMPLYYDYLTSSSKEEFPPVNNNNNNNNIKRANTETEASLESFEMAIRTLSQFQFVMLTELMSMSAATGPYSLESMLGWENMKDIHVVPSGNVMNNDAKSKLSQESYDFLWDANKFDMILYYWQKAVHLTRIHCSHLL